MSVRAAFPDASASRQSLPASYPPTSMHSPWSDNGLPIPLKMTGHSGERDRLHIAKTLVGDFYTNRSR
ncbi:MAG: hypothetical protein ABFS02_14440, partial [Pseudomonadota bacterium]